MSKAINKSGADPPSAESPRPPAGWRCIIEAERKARGRYRSMVEYLQSGGRLPREEIRLVLMAAGKDCDDLVDDVLTIERRLPRAGDPCDGSKCGGVFEVYRSVRGPQYVTRYLRCERCDRRAKQSLPAGAVRRRRKSLPNGGNKGI